MNSNKSQEIRKETDKETCKVKKGERKVKPTGMGGGKDDTNWKGLQMERKANKGNTKKDKGGYNESRKKLRERQHKKGAKIIRQVKKKGGKVRNCVKRCRGLM